MPATRGRDCHTRAEVSYVSVVSMGESVSALAISEDQTLVDISKTRTALQHQVRHSRWDRRLHGAEAGAWAMT